MLRLALKFFVILIFCNTCSVKGQVFDTIINNRPYAIHFVEPRETLYGISRQYNTELNDLVVSNPKVIKGLNVGFKLFVPLQYNLIQNLELKQQFSEEDIVSEKLIKLDSEKNDTNKINTIYKSKLDSSLIKVALLLPFYLDFNDSLKFSNKSKRIIYPKSKVALDFYFGFKLAMDSLTELGYNIDLIVLDIPNDSVLQLILNQNILFDREYIFGPIYIRQFEELAKFYGYDKNKKLISPLSYMSVNNNYLNIYQSVPMSFVQIEKIVENLLNTFKRDDIIILGNLDEDLLMDFVKRKMNLQIKNRKCNSFSFNKGDLSNRDLVKKQLNADTNIIVVPSNDRSFVSRLLPILSSMEDTVFTVYGLNTWNMFDNLDYGDLVNLNVHIPSVFMNDGSELYSKFVDRFYKNYFSYPKKYAFSGYKQCLYFLSYEFNDLLNFQKFSNTSFYSNTFFNIIEYKNYERVVLE